MIRANDTRITPMRAVIQPIHAVEKGQEAAHQVIVDTRLLKFVTTLVGIPSPGVEVHVASEILGVSRGTIFRLIRDHRLGVRYIPLLGGKRGFPVPLVHTRGDFDPCAAGCASWGANVCGMVFCATFPQASPMGLNTRSAAYRTITRTGEADSTAGAGFARRAMALSSACVFRLPFPILRC